MGVRTPEVRMQRWAPGALIGLVMGDAFMEPQLLAELSKEKLSTEKLKTARTNLYTTLGGAHLTRGSMAFLDYGCELV